jgi:hypothetical protein
MPNKSKTINIKFYDIELGNNGTFGENSMSLACQCPIYIIIALNLKKGIPNLI